MLQMRFGQPNVARLPETAPADTLRVGTLDACARCILLLHLESHDAGLLLGPGTLRPVATRGAIFAGKTCLPRHPILGIGVREPGDALLAHRARYDLPLPVNEKLGFIEPCACPGLPSRV